MERVEGGDHETGGEEATYRVQVREREQAREDADGESVGVVVEGNDVEVVGADNAHNHRVGSSWMEGVHSFRIDSGEVGDRMKERAVEHGNGVQEVVVVGAQCVHTNNSHDDHTEYDLRVAESEKSG